MKLQMSYSVYSEVSAIVWSGSKLLLKICISKPTSSENTFEEISCSAKYLRAFLLIAYLFLSVHDSTDSTLNNVNEYMKT